MLTNFKERFAHCKESSLDFSSIDTSNVEDMSWCFYDCENLKYSGSEMEIPV